MRHAERGRDVVAIINATPIPRYGYRVGVPRLGRWVELANSDAEEFGGSGVTTGLPADASDTAWMGLLCSVVIGPPPLSAVLLAAEDGAEVRLRTWALLPAPRENPDREIDDEPSAAPFPNWNARIAAECYQANGAARVGEAADDVQNNYAWMSFNFGATLLDGWRERSLPCSNRCAADRASGAAARRATPARRASTTRSSRSVLRGTR